jgi:LysM repeat protein
VGRLIQERQLSDQEIQKMFTDIQASPAWSDAGGNRTLVGKGVDTARSAAGAVSGAWNKLKDQVYNSSVMQGFATKYDRAAESLKQATGGDQGLMQYVQKYRDFAEKHPIMQKAVYAALVAAAGIVGSAGGPAGIGAAVGLMQTFDKAIQGQDIRRALWSGAKAGAAAAGTATLAQYLQSANTAAAAPAPAAPTGQETVLVAKGQTLNDIAQNNGVSVKDMMAANPQITNPDVIRAGQELVLPSPTGAPVYQGGVGTAADTAAKIGTGQYTPSPISTAAAARAGLREQAHIAAIIKQIPLRRIPRASMINRDETMVSWTLNESLGRSRGGVYLTDLGVSTLFENLGRIRSVLVEADDPRVARAKAALGVGDQPLTDFGTVGAKRAAALQANQPKQPGFLSRAWGGIKGAAQKVGGALGRAGTELTTKVTAQRLQSNWNKIKEYDSDRLAQWLMDAPQSVPQAVVAQVYQSMNIPMPASTQPAAQEPAAAAPAAQEPAAAAPAATSAAPGASGLSADDLEQAKGAELALGGASKTQATTAPAVASAAAPAAPAAPTAGQEIEMPGTNQKFKFSPTWIDSQGTPAAQSVANVLNQLASGVSQADIAMSDLKAARRSMGLQEQKKAIKTGKK